MTRFFDRIVAAARTELATSLHAVRAAAPRTAPVVAAAAETDPAEPHALDPLVPSEMHPARQLVPDPTAPADRSRPMVPSVALSSPLSRAPLTPGVRSADPQAPSAAEDAAPGPRSTAQWRTGEQASALAGAWLEAPAARPPHPAARVQPPAGSPMDPRIVRAPSIAWFAPDRSPPPSGATTSQPAQSASPTVGADPMRRRMDLPPSVVQAPRPVSPPPLAAALRAPPAPSHHLHIEHLDVRIISEPAPRTPVKPASALRGPSQLGAWRPFARRYLGRP